MIAARGVLMRLFVKGGWTGVSGEVFWQVDHGRQGGGVIFIFIGGMQPKRVKLDDQARLCPACGARAARLVRHDNYLSLFFIPLVPLKRGQEVLECERCGSLSDPHVLNQVRPEPPAGGRSTQAPERCPRCGQGLQKQFIYCPNCGQKVRAA